MKEIIIDNSTANQRMDKFLKKYFKEASSGFIYKMLRKKNITLNKSKDDGSSILKSGDIISVFFSDETYDKMRGVASSNSEYGLYADLSYKIDIIYEDDNIIAFNKPAGMLSQKSKDGDVSINEHFLAYLVQNNKLTPEQYSVFHPSISNRLDYNTTGVILGAKTLQGQQELSKALKERTLDKYYIAVVAGELQQELVLRGSFTKDEATNKVDIINDGSDNVITEVIPIAGNKNYSLVKIHLVTGKTHQIRAHLATINHPIVGDMKYGNKAVNDKAYEDYKIKSQALHSYRTIYKDIEIEAPLPSRLSKLIEVEYGNLEF